MKAEDTDSAAIYTLPTDKKNTISRRQLKKIKEQESDFKFYSWDYKENYTYITYLKNFRAIFNSHEERKRAKVFSHISKLITTRNAHQIKSHHQKMLIRHKNIEAIIDYLRLKIIKHIKTYPQCVKNIEIINQDCQAFFLKQSGFQNRMENSSTKVKQQSNQELPYGVQKDKVKIEENMHELKYMQFVNTQLQHKDIRQGQVKVQACQQIRILKH